MPTYAYKARDATGKPVKGTMEAASKTELVDKLHKMGYMTTQVTEVRPGIKIETVFDKLKRINTEAMVMFNVQLSNMINAGISILTSLDTITNQIENKKLKDTVGSVTRSVEGGDSFSEALSRHPRIFSNLFMNMVKAGEASGKLDIVLARFAEFFERQAELRQKIKGALFYPVILLIAGIAVTLFIVTFIIPQFAQIFVKSGLTLPLPTLILYKAGIAIKQFWYLFILFVIAVGLGISWYAKTMNGRLKIDRIKLKLPVIGSLHRKAIISMFTRTLSTLVGSGVPILESLAITKEVAGNEIIARVIGNVHMAVEKGEKIAEPLRISGEFPPDVVQMVSVGEESGKLEELLNKTADIYDRAVGYTINKLTAIIEPLFLLVLGGLVGLIMASLLLPIFDMVQMLRR